MPTAAYQVRRGQIEAYFDRTAVQAWARLTSDAPVSRIRATVRAGRDHMRATLLDWLPQDLTGRRILDAGCGTGALALEVARRGGDVVAIDLSATLIGLAQDRAGAELTPGRVEFRVGDMLDPELGCFDHAIAMDSLIHYRPRDMVQMVAQLAARAQNSVLFTFAPRTAALTMMHAAGRVFPRGNRSPSIEPVGPATLKRLIATDPGLEHWQADRTQRIKSGFYISQALELTTK